MPKYYMRRKLAFMGLGIIHGSMILFAGVQETVRDFLMRFSEVDDYGSHYE